jgi:hypothetical protein
MFDYLLNYELIQVDFSLDDNENVLHSMDPLVMLVKKEVQDKKNTLIQLKLIDKLLYYYQIQMVNNEQQDQMLILQLIEHWN